MNFDFVITDNGEISERPVYMKVQDLNRQQLTQLKQAHYIDTHEKVYYSDMADIDSIISDAAIYEEYQDMNFTPEDFI